MIKDIEKAEIPTPHSLKDMLLYKSDRTIAIIGLVAIGIYSLYKGTLADSPIVLAVIGSLGVYIGGRGLSK